MLTVGRAPATTRGGVRAKLNKTEPCANSTEKWREVRTG
jgi:hypothetical protein